MYLSNINSKKDNLQKVCKITYKSASLLAIYKAHLVRVRTRQSPWQICRCCPPRWICCGSYTSRGFKSCLVGFLRHRGEITCKITDRWRRSCVDGKGLEVPCVYTSLGKPRNCLSYYLWRLQTARTSCLPFNKLSSKPQPQKISQNATQQSMSISWNGIELPKPQQSQKSSQNATCGGGGCVHFLE